MMHSDPEYFIAKAEQCFRLARQLRGAPTDRAAAELDAIAHEFLACAVAIDTARDREATRRLRKPGYFGSSSGGGALAG